MDFNLSEEQCLFQDEVRRFGKKIIAPGVEGREEKGEFSPEIWKELCDFGLAGLSIPAEFGGSGGTAMDTVVALMAFTESGRDFSLSGIWASHLLLTAMPIVDLGSQEQKEKYLPLMATGKKIGALCLTETESGSDATSLRTTAVRKGDHYILNGSKTFISNAPIADVFLVVATVESGSGSNGLTIFIVDRDCPGLSTGKPLKKRECDSWPTGEIFFDDCKVPVANRLGEERKGFQYMLKSLMWERLAFSPYVGIMDSNLQDSIEYAKQRQQFGRPIGRNQLVQAMLAEMKMDLEASRLLVYNLAWKIDQKHSIVLEAAIAKTFITEAAERNAYKAVQIFGGNGCMKDYSIGRGLWITKMGTIGGGTSQMQRTIIGRMLLEK